MLYTLFPFSLEANLQLHGVHGLKVWNRQHLLLFRSECLCPSAFSGRKRRWHQNYLRIRIRSPSEKQLTSPNIFLFKFRATDYLFLGLEQFTTTSPRTKMKLNSVKEISDFSLSLSNYGIFKCLWYNFHSVYNLNCLQ